MSTIRSRPSNTTHSSASSQTSAPGTPALKVPAAPAIASPVTVGGLSVKAPITKQHDGSRDQAAPATPAALITDRAKTPSTSGEEALKPSGSKSKAASNSLAFSLGTGGAHFTGKGKAKKTTSEQEAANSAKEKAGRQSKAFQTEWKKLSSIDEFGYSQKLVRKGGEEYSLGGLDFGVPNPRPSVAHLGAEGQQFLRATRWTQTNLEKLRSRAQSHGDRKTRGGWEAVQGTPEEIQRKTMIRVNDILHHPEMVAYMHDDSDFGRTLRFRVPMSFSGN